MQTAKFLKERDATQVSELPTLNGGSEDSDHITYASNEFEEYKLDELMKYSSPNRSIIGINVIRLFYYTYQKSKH